MRIDGGDRRVSRSTLKADRSADISTFRLCVVTMICVVMVLPAIPAFADDKPSCPEMTKQLSDLRRQYVDYVHWRTDESKQVTFAGVTKLLDKILALKDKMRKANCGIRTRKSDLEGGPKKPGK